MYVNIVNGYPVGVISRKHRGQRGVAVNACNNLRLRKSTTEQGWAEKFRGWLRYNDRIWPKVFFFFLLQNSLPCGPHTSSICAAQRLNSCGIEALILILEKSSTADMTSSSVRYCFPAKCFFVLGEQKIVRLCQIRIIMEGDQPAQSHSHEQQLLQPQTCVQAHCPVPVKQRTPFVYFPGRFEMSLYIDTTFQSLEETMQFVSGKVE